MKSVALVVLLAACGGHHGQIHTDSPVTPYEKPDISEITGIDEDDASDAEAAKPAPEAAKPAAPAAPAKK
ncbi:MAG: hypothetical protein QM831_37325 [Kofleriaceae bacterium]